MISSISILLLSFLFLPIHSFYITNAGVIEQCPSKPTLYLNKFELNKMRCLNSVWRRVSLNLEYKCVGKFVINQWTGKTNAGGNAAWPSTVSIVTNTNTNYFVQKQFTKIPNQKDITLQEEPRSFDPNNNQFKTYIWTGVTKGPQCRVQYTVTKSICDVQPIGGPIGAIFNSFLCYHGQTTFKFNEQTGRDAFDKFLDNTKPGSTIPQTGSSNSSKPQPNPSTNNSNSQEDPHLSALSGGEQTFLAKNKLLLFIGGGIGIVLVVGAIVFIVTRRGSPSNKNIQSRMSAESDME